MNASVDKDTCISCGLCPSLCPEVFEMQDDGKAGVIPGGIQENKEADAKVVDAIQAAAKEAEDSCPVNAISVSIP